MVSINEIASNHNRNTYMGSKKEQADNYDDYNFTDSFGEETEQPLLLASIR